MILHGYPFMINRRSIVFTIQALSIVVFAVNRRRIDVNKVVTDLDINFFIVGLASLVVIPSTGSILQRRNFFKKRNFEE